jgi:predicted AAA+ superfamily ATPase
MQYSRHIESKHQKHFQTYKQAIVLLGARQVGKTTLLKRMFSNATYLLVDDEQTRKILEFFDINTYK